MCWVESNQVYKEKARKPDWNDIIDCCCGQRWCFGLNKISYYNTWGKLNK